MTHVTKKIKKLFLILSDRYVLVT